MSTTVLLVLYSALIVLASLAGGWLALLLRLTHRRMQIAISFVAGVMLGIGLLRLLPHSAFELSIDAAVGWGMAGFLVTFFLERFFHFHHHEGFEDEHGHDHGHAHCEQHAPPALLAAHQLSWVGAAVGLAVHGLIDGFAVAAAVIAEEHGGQIPPWAGMGAFLAVLLHKPFDSLAIGTLMSAAGHSSKARHLVNVAYALVVPLGVAALVLGAEQMGSTPLLLGRALGFAAGTFLCIATSDLLPELQFHHHDRGKLSLSLLLGVALAWAMIYFETAGHDHHRHGDTSGHSHDHAHDEEHAHDHGDSRTEEGKGTADGR